MQSVTVQFFKYPDLPHWGHEGFILGEDDYGTWMGSPVGSRRWKGAEEFRPVAADFVMCAPHQGWWHLYYNGASGHKLSHFIDITTQPIWVAADRVEMVDLDLDVIRTVEGQVEIDDQDEFEVHSIRYGYTEEMNTRAPAEADMLVAALVEGREPFFEVAEAWLRRVNISND